MDWTVRKSGSPATVTSSAARIASAWAGPLVEKPTVRPWAAASASAACSFLSVRAGLSGGHRVDLVQVEPVAEQPGALGALPFEGGEAVVLDLVPLGVGGPAGGVGVAPLAADDDVVDLGVRVQPVGEELLGAAVGAGDVDVAHALGVGGVEEVVGAGAQRLDAAVLSEVAVPAEGDVAGAADGGEAESEVAGRGRRCRQSGEGHRGLRSVGCGFRPT
ncbi:hypothetical protein GCM10020295_68050 [Streptomyces cinereospinus]